MSQPHLDRAKAIYFQVFNVPMPIHVAECFHAVLTTGKATHTREDSRLGGFTAIPLIIGIMYAKRCRPYTLVSSNFHQARVLRTIRDNPMVLSAPKRRYLTIKMEA